MYVIFHVNFDKVMVSNNFMSVERLVTFHVSFEKERMTCMRISDNNILELSICLVSVNKMLFFKMTFFKEKMKFG